MNFMLIAVLEEDYFLFISNNDREAFYFITSQVIQSKHLKYFVIKCFFDWK